MVTSLPQTELCLSLLGCACLCSAVPVFVRLCLSLLRCACLCYAVPVFVTLCLSLLGCVCLCSAVPVRVGLCLSLLGCACVCYAVPNRVQLCWPLRVPLLFRNRILTLIPLYTGESTLVMDSPVPLMNYDPKERSHSHSSVLCNKKKQRMVSLVKKIKYACI